MEKPIIFSTDMVRAILDGRKTQTRRINRDMHKHCEVFCFDKENRTYGITEFTPFGTQICQAERSMRICSGDVLWVRETWYYEEHMHDATAGMPDTPSGRYLHRYVFRADSPDYPVDVGVGRQGWRPSIHMPREAARLFLRVTGVCLERLRDISPYDIIAEGVCSGLAEQDSPTRWEADLQKKFAALWDSIYKAKGYGWHANPWVWVYTFERIDEP